MGKVNAKGRSKAAFVMILHGMMNTPAWQDLSGNSVKLLLHLVKLSQGNNGWGHGGEGGELFLAEREAARAIGVSRNTASRAFAELVEHGFLRVVSAGHFQVKVKRATTWRLTFQPYPRRHQGPTNEYRQWQPEQKSRAQNLTGTGAKTGPKPELKAATGAKSDPEKSANGENPPNAIGSISAPHIDIPGGRDVSEPAPTSISRQIRPSLVGGVFRAPSLSAA